MNKTIFTECPKTNQLLVTRVFRGPLDLVWQAWTDSDLLDQWWSPEGWESSTKSMEFIEGGYRFFCMEGHMDGHEGEQHWGKTTYLKIVPKEYFEAEDAFCDENGILSQELPTTHWKIQFHEVPNGTEVRAMNTYPSKEAMVELMAIGVKEGTIMVYEKLDKLLLEVVQK